MSAPLIDEDEQYASSEDSDFAPDAAPAQDSEQSDSEDEAAGSDRPSKRQRTEGGQGDAGYDNSGDEAIIKRGEKKKRKKGKDKTGLDAEDDEGGEGGLIKTRRQRAAEYDHLAPV